MNHNYLYSRKNKLFAENRLLYKDAPSSSVDAFAFNALQAKTTEDLNKAINEVPTVNEQEFEQTFAEKFLGLEEKEKQEIYANLDNLVKGQSTKARSLLRRIIEVSEEAKKLKAAEASVSSEAQNSEFAATQPATPEGEGFMAKANALMNKATEKAGEAITYVKENPYEVGARAVYTASGVLLAYLAYRGVKKFFGWGKNKPKEDTKDAAAQAKAAVKESKMGMFKKFLGYSLIATGTVFGAKWIIDYASKKFSAAGIMGAAAGVGKDVVDRVKSLEFGLNPEKKYGLSAEKYDEAVKVYKEKGEPGLPEIYRIFGTTETTPEIELFIKDQREQYKEEEGIQYARPREALDAYGKSIGIALSHLKTWVENHPAELVAGTYLASRLGILRAILSGGATTIQQAAQIGLAMARWGIRHPFVTLFTVGGTLAGSAVAAKAYDVYLPANFKELSKAYATGKKLVLTSSSSSVNWNNELEAIAKAFGGAIEDFGSWSQKQIESLGDIVGEDIPDFVAFTPQETIAERHIESFSALRAYLLRKQEEAKMDRKEVEKGMVSKYETTLDTLERFQNAYIAYRCNEQSDDVLPESEFNKVKVALEAVGIVVNTSGKVFTWKNADENEDWSLCIDPSIKDLEDMHLLAHTIHHGQSDLSLMFAGALDRVREEQQKNIEKFPNIFGGKWAAMVVGNFLYFTDFDANGLEWKKPIYYIVDIANIPVNIAQEIFNSGENELGVDITNSVISTSLFALNAGAIAKLKRFIIGGGPLVRQRGLRLAVNVIPGPSQINAIWSTVRGIKDFNMIGKFGYWDARFINTLCYKAGVRPEWIHLTEVGNYDELVALAKNKLNIGETAMKEILDEPDLVIKTNKLREFVRNAITEKLQHHRVWDPRHLAQKKFWHGFFRADTTEDYYEIIAKGFKERSPLEILKKGGTINEALKGAVRSATEIRNLYKAGADALLLLKRGATVDELLDAGIPAGEFIKGMSSGKWGTPVYELMKKGKTLSELYHFERVPLQYFVESVKAHDILYSDLRAFASADELVKWGVNADELLKAGYALDEVAKVRSLFSDLLKMGKTLEELAKAGAHVDDLVKGAIEMGVTSAEFVARGLGTADDFARVSTQLAKIAKATKVLKWGGRALGVAAAGVEIGVYNLLEAPALEAAWNAEKDPQKKERIYAEWQTKHRRTWASSAGGGMLLVPFPPVQIVGGVMVATSLVGDYVADGIYASADYHLQTETQMYRNMSSGQILNEISKSNPGQFISFRQSLAADRFFMFAENMDSVFDAANTATRSNAYRAYFKQVGGDILPALNAVYLSKEDANSSEDFKKQRLRDLNEEYLARFVTGAERYISVSTGKTMVAVDADLLKRAEVFGQMKANAYAMELLGQEAPEIPSLTTEEDLAKLNGMIDAQLKGKDEAMAEQLDSWKKKMPEMYKQMAPIFFATAIQHELAQCEQKIQAADYSNTYYVSGDEYLQAAARGVFAWRLIQRLRVIKNGNFKKENFAGDIKSLTDLLEGDPNEVMNVDENKNGDVDDDVAEYEEYGRNPMVLTPLELVKLV